MKTIAIAAAAFVLGIGATFVINATAAPTPAPAAPAASSAQAMHFTKTTTGQPIEVVAHPEVIVSVVTIPVGGKTTVHKHPYQRYVVVLAGNLRVTEVATGKSLDFVAGDFLPEMRDAWHFGTNTGADPVQLLVIDQVPPGTASNMVMQGQ